MAGAIRTRRPKGDPWNEENVTFAFLAWRPLRLELVRLNAAERHSKAVFNWAKRAVQDFLGWVGA